MIYLNGSYVKEEEAKISIFDLSVLRGYGVFDYLRTYQGRPFHLMEHLERFKSSAEQLHLELPLPLEEIAEIVHTILKSNGFAESGVKLIATGGISPDQFNPQATANLIIFAIAHTPPPPHFYSEGINVVTTQLSRSCPTSKTIQYIPAILALKNTNAKEALYLNAHREILEATTSNFFGIKDGTLYTCCSNEVLTGITREVILRLTRDIYPIQRRALHHDEIFSLDEAFITASNKEVMPVIQIDDHQLGTVGPITKHIQSLFREYTNQSEWPALSSINPCAKERSPLSSCESHH